MVGVPAMTLGEEFVFWREHGKSKFEENKKEETISFSVTSLRFAFRMKLVLRLSHSELPFSRQGVRGREAVSDSFARC